MKVFVSRASQAGFGLPELLVYAAMSAIAAAALYAGALSLQRSFVMAQQYVQTQSEQMRVLDYVAVDVRGARNVAWSADHKTLSLWLPNFYTTSDRTNPISRTPKLGENNQIIYGDGSLILVKYYQSGTTIVRQVGTAEPEVLVKNVESFKLDFPDTNHPKTVQATVSFIPKFKRSPQDTLTMRENNTGSVTLLLRNKLG